jgi:pimeloyl-ACP methyl ester carboxylesterase
MSEFVFLHGGRQGSWVWREVIEAMAQQAGAAAPRMLALDVPGCGVKCDRDVSGLSIPQVVDDLAGDLDRAGVTDAVIVGHSQAGTVLPSLIAARPKALRRAVYVTCCAPAPGQTVGDMMGPGLHGADAETVGWPKPFASTDWSELLLAMFCNDMDEPTLARFLAQLGKDDWPPACGGAFRDWTYDQGAPSTYVVALQDQSLPAAWQERFAARFGCERLQRIDAGHQLMQTRPQALAEVLLAEAAHTGFH